MTMQSTSSGEHASRSPEGDSHGAENGDLKASDGSQISNAWASKTKRIACMICRRRKLKCDGAKPSCSTCSRLGHSCAYDEVRRKSGPKRGYVKALEERLKQVETLLKTQEPTQGNNIQQTAHETGAAGHAQHASTMPNFSVTNPSINIATDGDMDRWQFNGESPQGGNIDEFGFNSNVQMGMSSGDSNFTWEMIGLGLEEPLPTQETIDELHQIYFTKVHPSVPMIHKLRYLAAMNLAPHQRPPVALRYAIWTLACAISDKYQHFKDLFYQRARKYVEADSIKGYGEHMISVAHTQTHVLLALYEFRMMYFPRAWISTGSAVRMCQMTGLHRLDGGGLEVKQCLPPPRDWTEREERRRTFWMAYCEDRYASIGTGWPMTIDERDILTQLPASDAAFELSRPEPTQTLQESMSPSGAAKLSAYGSIVLMATLFGRNLIHLHRPDVDDKDHDLNGEFWKRHRQMDNVLLNTTLCLPPELKLPAGLSNPSIVFTNMSIHTSTICLHQAAIFKADKNRLPPSVSAESKVRCITAANETASIMRMISHMDLSSVNPFLSFCLYVAARVFVQYLKSRPDDSQTADSLRFLLSAMNALKRRNPLTESFLVQLDVDLEALGQRIPKLRAAFPRSGDSPIPSSAGPRFVAPEATGQQGLPSRAKCTFLDISDETNLVDPEPDSSRDARRTSSGPPQGWATEDHRTQAYDGSSSGMINSVLTPGSGSLPGVGSSLYDKTGSSSNGAGASFGQPDASDANEMSDASNRPTPNSSAASDHRGHGHGHGHGQLTGSEPNSYRTSPGASHQTLSSQPGGVKGFYPDPSMFAMGGGGGTMGSAAGYAMPEGWGGLGGQTAGMTPVTEGVLKSLMSINPMEAMDLTPWESTS